MGVLGEKLKNYFELTTSSRSLEDLKKEFNIKNEKNIDLLLKELKKLELEGFLYEKNKEHSLLTDEFMVGILSIAGDGTGYVKNGSSIVVIEKDKLNAYDGDLVVVQKLYLKEQIYGKIDKILKRQHNELVCVINSSKLYPYMDKNKNEINIDCTDLLEGELVLIDLNSMKIIKHIGHRDEPDIDIKAIGYKYGFHTEFGDKVIKELKDIPNRVLEHKKVVTKNSDTKQKEVIYINELDGRTDLRDKIIFTIDGTDTKDMDDAVSIELLDNGNYKLSVHIADVSHYVKYGSSIFNEAYERGTSVYMTDTVIPMLPPQLSNGICSLNPKVDRLTKTCEMVVDPTGNIIDYDIYRSVINSKKKMSYEDINKIFEDSKMVEGYEPFLKDLFLMERLSKIFNKQKENRKYISFDIPEVKVKGTQSDINIEVKNQKTAENIIENFMVAANETVATHIFHMGLPFLYRVHEEPEEAIVKEFVEYLNSLGYNIKIKGNPATNIAIQNIAKQIESFDDCAIFVELLRNIMKKARYDNNNLGHFGLALVIYTHFTSPIRRLSDLIVHMLLDYYLDNNFEFDFDELEEMLNKASHQASVKEVDADKAEEEANLMRMAELLQDHIGEEYEAVIRAITPYGIFIRTNDFIPGRINMYDMSDDYYYFDNKINALIGKNNHIKYQVGDKITCCVASASKENRTINFKNPQLIYSKRKVLSRKI